MKIGDLVKIICKDGAVHFEVGVFLGKPKGTSPFRHMTRSFLIDGLIKKRSPLVYDLEVINESR